MLLKNNLVSCCETIKILIKIYYKWRQKNNLRRVLLKCIYRYLLLIINSETVSDFMCSILSKVVKTF